MTYPEAVKYLESFINYEKIPAYPYKESCKLERIKDFLGLIGNPQNSLKTIHIAGTKGKGSTCVFIAHILRQAGYATGLYTSPHLSDFRERIRILIPRTQNPEPRTDFEGMISKDELTLLVKKLKPSVETFNKNSEYGPLSFFEVYTALAFLYFKNKNVDFAVLETGLGGRLDATNASDSFVCALTSLSYEHTQKLGNALREIAAEKAGIIKRQKAKGKRQNSIVISAPQEKEAMDVIRKRCKETNAKLYEVNKDIFYEKTIKGFNLLGIYGEYPNLEIRLLGDHQLINASVAVAAIEALRDFGVIIGIDSIRSGLYNTVWPGRLEVVGRSPLIILDGAQNIASAKAIKQAIKGNFKYKRLILVLGISQDKDLSGVCGELKDIADAVILTKANNPRATGPQMLRSYFNEECVFITNNVKQAKQKALSMANKDDLILVTGSLFVVGEFRDVKI